VCTAACIWQVDTLVRSVRQRVSELGPGQRGTAMDPELRADWENLLRRASDAARDSSDAGAGEGAAADVDLSDHWAVLALDRHEQLSQRLLDGAFRRELMRWHPDHNLGSKQAYAVTRTRAIVHAYNALKAVRRR
jgi:hypothetical protein